MTVIVSVMGRKGGGTKTTIAKNLADECSRQGYSTILVDADSQGSASDGVSVTARDAFRALVLGEVDWNEALFPVPETFTGEARDNLWLVPSYDGQVDIETNADTPDLIYECFQLVRGGVDLVICDCSPALTNVHTGLFFASDYVIAPTTCEFDSVKAVGRTIAYLNGKAAQRSQYRPAQVLGVVPNRFDSTQKVQQTNLAYLQKAYARFRVFDPIHDWAIWGKASNLKMSIHAMTRRKKYQERLDAQAAYDEFLPVAKAVVETMKVQSHE